MDHHHRAALGVGRWVPVIAITPKSGVDSIGNLAGAGITGLIEDQFNRPALCDHPAGKNNPIAVEQFIFSSTAAVYGNPSEVPVREDGELKPMSPYGSSKLMTEIMLADAARAHNFRYVALRYFNVAGADPQGRTGQSTPNATHLIKVACEAALGKRPCIEVFGTDYPTEDGTCIRDYIHVTDLVRAHRAALRHLRDGGGSEIFNCGYSKGFSVLQVIDAVKRVSGADFEVRNAPRRAGDPAAIVAASDKIRVHLGWRPELDKLETIAAQALAWESHMHQFKHAS